MQINTKNMSNFSPPNKYNDKKGKITHVFGKKIKHYRKI